MNLEPIKILLIEDNPGDVELVKIGFQEAKVANEIQVITDGQTAIDFFENDNDMPDVVLLDINLPKIDGFEILKFIRTKSIVPNLPVIILTSSETEFDINKSYASNANSFVSKPVDFDKFSQAIKSLGNFWLSVVKLPRG